VFAPFHGAFERSVVSLSGAPLCGARRTVLRLWRSKTSPLLFASQCLRVSTPDLGHYRQ